jgi:CheY-like chemotaxis protein
MWSRLLGSALDGNRFTVSRTRVYYGAAFEAKKEILVDTMMNALILPLIPDSVARVVIQEALEHGGHTVMAAGDLGTAVKRLSESKPDLLITSPYIEDISGYDTAKFLRTKCHGLPVGKAHRSLLRVARLRCTAGGKLQSLQAPSSSLAVLL